MQSTNDPKTLDDVKAACRGTWESLSVELRPAEDRTGSGKVEATRLRRRFVYHEDDTFVGTITMYVDEYGEEFGERHKLVNRGRPLHLDQNRFSILYKMWLRHQIPKEVVRIQNGAERVIRNSHY